MSYLELPPEVRMIYAVICLITFIIAITDLVRIWSSFKEKFPAVVPALTVCANGLLYQTFSYTADWIAGTANSRLGPLFDIMMYMPAAAFGFLTLGTLAVSSVSYTVTSKKINSRITLRSIRDGFNSIETGVLMYREGGFILLANSIMQQISMDLTGKRVTDGEHFRGLISAPDNRIVLSDGTVYLIKENSLAVNNKTINEITAVDVTTQTRLREEIKQLEERKEAFNRRLSSYAQKADEVTIKKEILDTKIDVHEALGNALLVSKSYLNNDRNAPDKESLKTMWHKAIMFQETTVTNKEDHFRKELYDAAKVCGIDLTIEGVIPSRENVQIRKILAAATREAIINASRHASADMMVLNIEHSDGSVCFDFTNNGKAPETVREGGGLSSLRQLVENNGGTMEVLSAPQFSIIIKLPENES